MALNPRIALPRSHLTSPSSLSPANIVNDDMYGCASVSPPNPAAPPGGDDGSSGSSRPARQPWPKLYLDSGAGIHVVGDPTLLSNLRDAPAGMRVMAADGNTLPVTKIGDITMVAGFRIPDVHLAPGLKFDLISVRELTRNRICTFFDGDRAVLYEGPGLVGEAIAPQEEMYGLYVLKFLSVTKFPGGGLDGGIKLVPVWQGRSFGSVLCRLKALLQPRLFRAGPAAKKVMPELHVRNGVHREEKREKGKNSGRM